jgi:suppressor of G2 allele of SKP1
MKLVQLEKLFFISFQNNIIIPWKIFTRGSVDVKVCNINHVLQTESGGTVLSTNWNEVGAKTVDVKAPDGMEYKKFEHWLLSWYTRTDFPFMMSHFNGASTHHHRRYFNGEIYGIIWSFNRCPYLLTQIFRYLDLFINLPWISIRIFRWRRKGVCILETKKYNK